MIILIIIVPSDLCQLSFQTKKKLHINKSQLERLLDLFLSLLCESIIQCQINETVYNNYIMIKQRQLRRFNLLTLTLMICLINNSYAQQPFKTGEIHIQSKKYSVIQGQQAQIKVTLRRIIHRIPYESSFIRKPDVGLSVYNLQFDYNLEFSTKVIQENSSNSEVQFYIMGKPSQSNIYNSLSVMFIASDYDQLGIQMPWTQDMTSTLGISTVPGKKYEDRTFNFKNVDNLPIFPSTTKESNIRVSVYLTGIQALSETIENGYEKNYGYFSLSVPSYTPRAYTIRTKVKSLFAEVLINVIEFTVIYFDITKFAAKYQINSNYVVFSNFGGTFYKSSLSVPLQPLVQDNNFENTLQYFFGISEIQSSSGQKINLLAVQRFNYNNNGKLQNIVLTLQTQLKTVILMSTYSYIQYKPRDCSEIEKCCNQTTKPVYKIQMVGGKCFYLLCPYSCASCYNRVNCSTCPKTRTLTEDNRCVCLNDSYFQKNGEYQCRNCFQVNYCRTCQKEGLCITCFQGFALNQQSGKCQCQPGTYDSSANMNQTELFEKRDIICQKYPIHSSIIRIFDSTLTKGG